MCIGVCVCVCQGMPVCGTQFFEKNYYFFAFIKL